MEGDPGCYYHSSNNWDLNAVVRYACGGLVTPPPSSDDPFSSFLPPKAPLAVTEYEPPLLDVASLQFPDLPGSEDAVVVDELCKAFFTPWAPPPRQPLPQQLQPAAATSEDTPQLQPADAPPAMPQPPVQPASGGEGPRSKRKKKQEKKVVQRVAADGAAAADLWAWRKYGQKPIKGSPYPRGYYRCSSDKACAAKKMVERCRADPDTFLLTYCGDHNHPVPIHRNSLAGTTRHRELLPPPFAVGEQALVAAATEAALAEPSTVVPSTSAGMSPTTSLRSTSLEYDQEEDFDGAGARLLMEDVDMAGEDELLFFNPDEPPSMDFGVESSGNRTVNGGAGTSPPLLNVVYDTFVV